MFVKQKTIANVELVIVLHNKQGHALVHKFDIYNANISLFHQWLHYLHYR